MGSRCKLPRLTELAHKYACACFLYPRPKKPTHVVNCHVEGVKREENIGSSYAPAARCIKRLSKGHRVWREYLHRGTHNII